VRQTFALYSDESGGAGEKVHALAGVSGRWEDLDSLRLELDGHARRYGVGELKWIGVRKRKAKLGAAWDFLQSACRAAGQGKVRLDVLVWRGRHEARLKELYVSLLRHAVKGWGRGAWGFCPDQRTGMDWLGIVRGLRAFRSWQPQKSSENSLVQLADLVAGLSRFCREHPREYRSWRSKVRRSLPSASRGDGRGVTATQNRLEIAGGFLESCREEGLPVYFWEG
jgi:hypothetical protein